MKLCKVKLNGREILIAEGTVIDYWDIIDLAHPRPLYTITAVPRESNRPMGSQGRTIGPNESISVSDGLVIDCVHTGNA